MLARGVFVDDEHHQYAALLSTRGVLELDYQAVLPLTDQANAIRAALPTVVALDYRLDEVTPNVAAGHTYKGSGLAQVLRDGAMSAPEQDFAVILVSSDFKLETYFAPDKTAHDLFDMVYAKEAVTTQRGRIQGELRALSTAYLYLRARDGNYDPVALLAAGDDEEDRVRIQEITSALVQASAPHIASKFILRNLIERPGLLLDDNDAAALLGIEQAGFAELAPRLIEAGLIYAGIFSEGWRRWWANRVEDWAETLLEGALLDLTAKERAEGLSAKLEIDVRPALSPWNESPNEYISFACASCRRPTELRHSLAAFEARAPRFAQRRRICWDCIQNDFYLEPPNRFDVDESDAPLVADVKVRDRKA